MTELPVVVAQLLHNAPRDEEGLIELAEFTRALSTIAEREADPVLLIAAGILAHEAMKRLRKWSDEVRERAEAKPREPGDPWKLLAETPWMQQRTDHLRLARRAEVRRIESAAQHLRPAVRHDGHRKVTLLDLIGVLDGALHEAARRQAVQRAREERRARHRLAREAAPASAAHDEDVNEQISALKARIGARGVVHLREMAKTREELVAFLQAALYLAKSGNARLRQTPFPTGPIEVELATGGRTPE